ncbi:hypothetical protein HYV57_01520 [Candidatus Peregrinibacteria bacterium]|nr:hypothetical protein [Candidatus Peregrinibacteria bacterium]
MKPSSRQNDPFHRPKDDFDRFPLTKSKQYMWRFFQAIGFSVKVSPWQRFISFFLRNRVMIPSVAFAVLFVFFFQLFLPYLTRYEQGPPGNNFLLIDTAYAQDNFSLQPLKSDSTGIESNSDFLLTSKQPLSASQIESAMTVTPKIPVKIQEKTRTEYLISASQPFEKDKIVRFSIASQYKELQTGLLQKRDFQWAYQVQDRFKILSTLPANQAKYVPLHTGIEIAFSHENFENPENYFDIEPKTQGSFEKHFRTLVFVPESLKSETLYTVTIKPGMPLSGTNVVLEKGYSFQFETDSGSEEGDRFSFNSKMQEIGVGLKVDLPVYYYDSGPNFGELETQTNIKGSVRVFKYKDFQDFVAAARVYYNLPSWASFARDQYVIPTDDLFSVFSADVNLSKVEYQWYFSLPESLSAGYYVVQFEAFGKKTQTWLQSTNLIASAVAATNTTMVWIHDLQKKTFDGKVTVLDSDISVSVNNEGLAQFETPSSFLEGPAYRFLDISSTDGQNLLISLELRKPESGAQYWKYAYLDRQMYHPNDTLQFWGFIQGRDIPTPKSIHVTLNDVSLSGYLNSSDEDGSKPLMEKDILLTDTTFSGLFELKDFSPGSYHISFFDGKEEIFTKWFGVQTYVKPVYKFDISRSKNAVFQDDSVDFDISSRFFDGTPVPNMGLKYSGNWRDPVNITTDKDGKARVSSKIHADHSCDKYCSLYDIWSMQVQPQLSEEGEIVEDAFVYLFYSGIGMKTDSERISESQIKAKVDAFFVDLSRLNSEDFSLNDVSNYEGAKAPNRAIEGEVIQSTWVKIMGGDRYDFILKKVVPTYRYELKEDVIERFSGVTDSNGSFERIFTLTPDMLKLEASYEMVARMKDDKGNISQNNIWLSPDNRYPETTPYLEPKVRATDGYDVGQEVSLDLFQEKQPLPKDGDYLFYRVNNGIQDILLSSDPQYRFTFSDKDIPGPVVYALVYDGQRYLKSEPFWTDFRAESKKLDISLETDKETYAPKDTVKLSLVVKDGQGNPVASDVNLNLVDEAFYKLFYFSNVPNPRDDLYAFSWDGVLSDYLSHNISLSFRNGGMGGCFVAGTQITMADGSTKNIEEIQAGESILTFQDPMSEKKVSSSVIRTFEHVVKRYLNINNRLKITPEHVLFVNDSWKMASEIRIGDRLIDMNRQVIIVDSIEDVETQIPVYNLEVLGTHTFFANGIYVHNNKGDGGVRQDFKDTAFFKTIQTGKDGKGFVEFQLPDNLTSWRATAQGVTSDRFAGFSSKNIDVSLPLFVDTVNAQSYLTADKPVLKVRAFGKDLQSKDRVDFTVEVEDQKKVSISGTAYESVPFSLFDLFRKSGESSLNVQIPSVGQSLSAGQPVSVEQPVSAETPVLVEQSSLAEQPPSAAQSSSLEQIPAGQYFLKTTAQKGDIKDTLREPFQILSSRFSRPKVWSSSLKEGLQVVGNNQGRTELRIMDQNKGSAYSFLQSVLYGQGERLDQMLADKTARIFLKEYFGDNSVAFSGDFYRYQNQFGGISLLSYGDSELELSVFATPFSDGVFDQSSLKKYFYSILDDKKSNTDEIILALFGLAHMDEPVLTYLENVSVLSPLSPFSRLLLALSFERLGAGEKSRSFFQSLLKESQIQNDTLFLQDPSGNNDATLKLTILMAGLAVRLQDASYARFWRFTESHFPTDNLFYFEKLYFIKALLAKIGSSVGSFTLQVGDRNFYETLEKGKIFSLSLSSDELAKTKIQNAQGSLLVTTIFDAPSDIYDEQVDSSLSLRREYWVNGKKTTEFHDGDLIEVRLYPWVQGGFPAKQTINFPAVERFAIQSDTPIQDGFQENQSYGIRDILPSGMRPVISAPGFLLDSSSDCLFSRVSSVRDQEVSFILNVSKDIICSTYIVSYYARIINTGEFLAEPALLYKIENPYIFNFSESAKVKIQP